MFPRPPPTRFPDSVWCPEMSESLTLVSTPNRGIESGVACAETVPPSQGEGRRREKATREEMMESTTSMGASRLSNPDSDDLAVSRALSEQTLVGYRGDAAGSLPKGKSELGLCFHYHILSPAKSDSNLAVPIKQTGSTEVSLSERCADHASWTLPMAFLDRYEEDVESHNNVLDRVGGLWHLAHMDEMVQENSLRLSSRSGTSSLSPASQLHPLELHEAISAKIQVTQPSSNATLRGGRSYSRPHCSLSQANPSNGVSLTAPTGCLHPFDKDLHHGAMSSFSTSGGVSPAPEVSRSSPSSLDKTQAFPMLGVLGSHVQLSGSEPLVKGNIVKSQRLDFQSPLPSLHSESLSVILPTRRILLLPPPPPPLTHRVSPAIYEVDSSAAVPSFLSDTVTAVKDLPPSTFSEALTQPTVTLLRSCGLMVPVQPYRPPANLVHYHRADPHKAAAVTPLFKVS